MRVAVIAVHGVADQRPCTSANAVAALLAGARPAEYAAFAAESLRLTLAPVRPRVAPVPAAPRHPFDERLSVTRALVSPPLGAAPDRPGDALDPPSGRLADAAMAAHLAAYDPTGREPTFETRRLVGRRAPRTSGEAPAEVHVYEAHWADLSQLRRGVLRFVAELYQLLLHLGSLGRQTTDLAAAEWPTRRWRWAARTYAWAVRVLTLPIALGNLVLLVAVFAALPAARLAAGARAELVVGVAGALGTAAGALVVWGLARRRNAAPGGRAPSRGLWLLLPALGGAVAALAMGRVVVGAPARSAVALAAAWWLLGAAGLAPAVRRYQRLRPGAAAVFATLYAAAVVAFAVGVARASHEPLPGAPGAGLVAAGVLAAAQLLYGVQRAGWIAFVALALVAGALRWLAGRPVTGPDARARVRDVATTARLALAVPALGFLSLTLFVWSGVYAVERRWLGLYANTPTAEWFRDTLGRSAGPGFVVVLALATLCLTALVVMLAPSVLAEVRRPRSRPSAGGDAAGARTLGRWLDVGFALAGPMSAVAWAAAFGVLAAFFVADTAAQLGFGAPWMVRVLDATGLASLGVLDRAGTLVLLSAVVLVALRAVLATASSALDVLLDVDNYLRNGPREATPRSRIAERYASLLRHVAGEGYDEVVVVAHSLGAVVTADLFRFLRRAAHEPALAPLGLDGSGRPGTVRLTLFTMGCPLRQLFGRFFPHLYGWARGGPGDAAAAGAPPGQPPPLRELLGVAEWVNVYRSGDYVGRWLWRVAAGDPRDPYVRGDGPPGDVVMWEGAGCREGCIGRGAHTHYWDVTAPDVGVLLDAMVGRAAALGRTRRAAPP